MNKKDYLKNEEESQARLKYEKEWLASLRAEYIASNSEYEIGERIKVITPSQKFYRFDSGAEGMTNRTKQFAYVDGYEITWDGSVIPTLKKEKKDGTISKQSLYYSGKPSFIERVK